MANITPYQKTEPDHVARFLDCGASVDNALLAGDLETARVRAASWFAACEALAAAVTSDDAAARIVAMQRVAGPIVTACMREAEAGADWRARGQCYPVSGQLEALAEWPLARDAAKVAELRAVAGTGDAVHADGSNAPAPANAPADRRPIGERVSEHVRAKREQGVEPGDHQLSRDAIADALDVSGGSVSNTKAWKALAKERQRAKPAGREDEALAAAERGDWRPMERLQEQQDALNRRQRLAEDWISPKD